MKSILDPSFKYTKSVDTDLRKTFARIRRELRKQIPPASVNNVRLFDANQQRERQRLVR